MTRVAVIGAGAIAREHLRAFGAQPGVELVAIHSRTRTKAERLAEEFGIGRVSDTIDALYADARPELVVVAVTIPATLQTCLSCLEHEAVLLVEKPLGLNLAECETVVAEAAARKRMGFVAFNRRFHASSIWVHEGLTNAGQRFIRVEDQEDTDAASLDGHAPEVLDNWMFANSIHLVDMIRYFGRGAVSRVTPIRPYRGKDKSLEIIAEVEFTSGDIALYECLWNAQGPWAVTVHTRPLRYEMRPTETAFRQTRESREREAMPDDPRDKEFKPGFFRQAQAALAAVRGEPHALASFADALETTRLTHSIYGL